MDADGGIRIDVLLPQSSPPVRVGVNGFGRIGRAFTRLIATHVRKGLITLVHINDPHMNITQMEYLLKYDSTYGRFKHNVEMEEEFDPSTTPGKGAATHECLKIGNKSEMFSVRVTHEEKFKDIPWNESGVEYVVECSGVCLTMVKASDHLSAAGVQKVILSAPAKESTIPMFVIGVNQKSYVPGTRVLSNASCTTNCLAPIASVIDASFGIEEALMTTVHAVTASQKVVDSAGGKNNRSNRCALDNIIPTTTGAAEACSVILPSLQGKITGLALRVPVSHVSVVDLTVRTTNPTSLQGIMDAMKGEMAKSMPLEDLMQICEEETVSTDWTSSLFSAIIDRPSCIQLNDHFFKILAFYDNEMGYAARLVDLVHYVRVRELEHAEKDSPDCLAASGNG